MIDVIFLVLIILHVTFIVAWMGGAVLFVSVISPATRKMSDSSRMDFVQSAIPRYVRFVAGSSAMAIIFGTILYAYSVQIAPATGPSSSTGLMEIQAGALFGLIALILLFALVIPASRKLVQATKQGPPPRNADTMSPAATASGEIVRLQNRMRAGSGIGVLLLLLALIMMLVGATI